MIMINKICDTHRHIHTLMCCRRSVSSLWLFGAWVLFLPRIVVATTAFKQKRRHKKVINISLKFNSIYFFELKFFQTENLFCFARKFHLLSFEMAAACVAAQKSDWHIYLFNAIKLMGWQTANDKRNTTFAAMTKKRKTNNNSNIQISSNKNQMVCHCCCCCCCWYASSVVFLFALKL